MNMSLKENERLLAILAQLNVGCVCLDIEEKRAIESGSVKKVVYLEGIRDRVSTDVWGVLGTQLPKQ